MDSDAIYVCDDRKIISFDYIVSVISYYGTLVINIIYGLYLF